MRDKALEAVNLEAGDYLAADGVIYPIVAYLDAQGCECEWYEANVAIAGGSGRWFPINLEEFKGRPS